MSSQLVKQSLSLLSVNDTKDRVGKQQQQQQTRRSSRVEKTTTSSNTKKRGSKVVSAATLLRQAGKLGLKRERERQKRRCSTGQLVRAVHIHRTTDPLDAIRNEATEQEKQMKDNLAYLTKTSSITAKEAKSRQRVLARLNEEAAAKQATRQRIRQSRDQRLADASDEEWAALDD